MPESWILVALCCFALRCNTLLNACLKSSCQTILLHSEYFSAICNVTVFNVAFYISSDCNWLWFMTLYGKIPFVKETNDVQITGLCALVQLCVRSPIMCKIMHAHNRVIPLSLHCCIPEKVVKHSSKCSVCWFRTAFSVMVSSWHILLTLYRSAMFCKTAILQSEAVLTIFCCVAIY